MKVKEEWEHETENISCRYSCITKASPNKWMIARQIESMLCVWAEEYKHRNSNKWEGRSRRDVQAILKHLNVTPGALGEIKALRQYTGTIRSVKRMVGDAWWRMNRRVPGTRQTTWSLHYCNVANSCCSFTKSMKREVWNVDKIIKDLSWWLIWCVGWGSRRNQWCVQVHWLNWVHSDAADIENSREKIRMGRE